MPSLAKKLAGKLFLIVDAHTNTAVGSAPTLKAARNKAQKKDLEYGGSKYRAMTKQQFEDLKQRDTRDPKQMATDRQSAFEKKYKEDPFSTYD